MTCSHQTTQRSMSGFHMFKWVCWFLCVCGSVWKATECESLSGESWRYIFSFNSRTVFSVFGCLPIFRRPEHFACERDAILIWMPDCVCVLRALPCCFPCVWYGMICCKHTQCVLKRIVAVSFALSCCCCRMKQFCLSAHFPKPTRARVALHLAG